MKIVDPHIHLWDLRTGVYPHLETPSADYSGSNAAIARNYLAAEYLEEGGPDWEIVGAVHVEAFPTDPLAEVAHLQKVADAFPAPLGVVGYADLSAPDLGALLDRQAGHPAFRGVRQVLNLHPDPTFAYVRRDFMAEAAWRAGLRELARRGLSFDLQCYPHQAGDAAALAGANPELTVIINHALMWADRTRAGWAAWKAGLRALAARDNVSVKIAGLAMFDPRWTPAGVAPLVFETLEAFGTGRAMFASNFPVDKRSGSFAELWSAFDRMTADLSADERDALFRGNAARAYRLGAPAAMPRA